MTNPKNLSSIKFDIERGPGGSGSWGYAAREFTTEWALFYGFGDEFWSEWYPTQDFDKMPLGLVDISHPTRSAALVIAEQYKGGNVFEGDVPLDFSVLKRYADTTHWRSPL